MCSTSTVTLDGRLKRTNSGRRGGCKWAMWGGWPHRKVRRGVSAPTHWPTHRPAPLVHTCPTWKGGEAGVESGRDWMCCLQPVPDLRVLRLAMGPLVTWPALFLLGSKTKSHSETQLHTSHSFFSFVGSPRPSLLILFVRWLVCNCNVCVIPPAPRLHFLSPCVWPLRHNRKKKNR